MLGILWEMKCHDRGAASICVTNDTCKIMTHRKCKEKKLM
jgi:hypothetical protein